MAEPSTLDALQAFHQEILSLHEGRVEGVEVFENEFLVQVFEQELARVWNRPPPSEASRNTVKTGSWHHLHRGPTAILTHSRQDHDGWRRILDQRGVPTNCADAVRRTVSRRNPVCAMPPRESTRYTSTWSIITGVRSHQISSTTQICARRFEAPAGYGAVRRTVFLGGCQDLHRGTHLWFDRSVSLALLEVHGNH